MDGGQVRRDKETSTCSARVLCVCCNAGIAHSHYRRQCRPVVVASSWLAIRGLVVGRHGGCLLQYGAMQVCVLIMRVL